MNINIINKLPNQPPFKRKYIQFFRLVCSSILYSIILAYSLTLIIIDEKTQTDHPVSARRHHHLLHHVVLPTHVSTC